MKLYVLPKELILDIVHFLRRCDVENARQVSIQWNYAIERDSYSFTAVTTAEFTDNGDYESAVVDDRLVFPEGCQSYHRVAAIEIVSAIALRRRRGYELVKTSRSTYENVEFFAFEFHPEITPLGTPLCTIFDSWFHITAAEFAAYIERCWSSKGYFFNGAHNEAFVKTLLLSRTIQTSERLHMYGVASAQNMSVGSCDDATMSYCFAPDVPADRVAKIGEILPGANLVDRIMQEYQSLRSTARFPHSLTLQFTLIRANRGLASDSDLKELFHFGHTYVPLDIRKHASLQYKVFVVTHAATDEKLSLRVRFANNSIVVRFKKIVPQQSLMDIIH